MIKDIKISNFKAVPYFETSELAKNHPSGFAMSLCKPNVIVGPNGSGKSALIKTLSLKTLSYYMGVSCFDDKYVISNESDKMWTNLGGWNQSFVYLSGLDCSFDKGLTLYYRPGAAPGNERCIATAMMSGYFEEARAYGKLIDKKSSGQQSYAVLETILSMLKGEADPLEYLYVNWRAGKALKPEDRLRRASSFEIQAETLKKLYGEVSPDAIPLVLMDEPEQSLDAKSEAILWGLIKNADCSKMQVIVATHSFYPILHPEHFNVIEAVPGYIDAVRCLI